MGSSFPSTSLAIRGDAARRRDAEARRVTEWHANASPTRVAPYGSRLRPWGAPTRGSPPGLRNRSASTVPKSHAPARGEECYTHCSSSALGTQGEQCFVQDQRTAGQGHRPGDTAREGIAGLRLNEYRPCKRSFAHDHCGVIQGIPPVYAGATWASCWACHALAVATLLLGGTSTCLVLLEGHEAPIDDHGMPRDIGRRLGTQPHRRGGNFLGCAPPLERRERHH
jgi:hypothetical protein